MKKKILMLVCVGFVFSLAGCGKSDQQIQAEKDREVSKKMGSTAYIPRVVVAPDAPAKEKAKDK